MKIANNNAGMFIYMSDDERNEITKDGTRTHVYVVFNVNAVKSFIQIMPEPSQQAIQATIYAVERASVTSRWQLKLVGKRFVGLANLPKFSPEDVTYETTNTHSGLVFDIHRPPMERAPNGGRAIVNYGRRKPKQEDKPVNSGGLPLVPPSPDKEIMAEASITINIRTAIDMVNAYKKEHGDACKLEITPNGKLILMMLYGGDDE